MQFMHNGLPDVRVCLVCITVLQPVYWCKCEAAGSYVTIISLIPQHRQLESL